MSESKCDDTYDINEGDQVTLETADEQAVNMTCTSRDEYSPNSHPDIREITTWYFEGQEGSGTTYQLRRVTKSKSFKIENPSGASPSTKPLKWFQST